MNHKKEVIYILKMAILEIRKEGAVLNNSLIFKLADLIHNIPGLLSQDEPKWNEALDELTSRAGRGGYEKWVKDRQAECNKTDDSV